MRNRLVGRNPFVNQVASFIQEGREFRRAIEVAIPS